jgi:hypothetical protein
VNIGDARSLEQEAAEDIFFGQVVLIWARWFLIAAGATFFLWTAHESTQLALGVLPIVGLMAMNFYLHGRYFLERPSNVLQIVTAAALDLALISAIVVLWHDARGVGTGLASPFFVFLYPVLLAFAFVLPRRLTVVYTAAACAAYAAVCLPDVDSVASAKVLVLRLVTMAATGALGTFYWRIQRDRRREQA